MSDGYLCQGRRSFAITQTLYDEDGRPAKRVHGIVTGDSLGQVASQTIESMDVIGRTVERVILRPVVTI